METGGTRSHSGATRPDDAAHLLHLIANLSRELRSARDTPRVSLESRLGEDLGFDSLGRAELLLRIERTFCVSLPGSTLAEAETPADLWRAMEAAGARRATPPPLADAAPGHVYTIGCLAGLLLICACAGSAAADRNFSQYPGFAEYFAANPPAEAAGQADRALARRHAPRFHLPAGHEGPIDFYRDYIAHGYLITGDGVRIDGPTASDLNRYRDDVRAEFTHVLGTAEPRPVVYSTVVRTGLWAPREPDRAAEEFTVVTYHLAFRVSGLPAGLSVAAAIPLRLVADLDDWHQLDHYTAAFVVLAADGRPVALTLQQHNYLRTHLVGESVKLGSDGGFDIDVAIRSNELYPHTPGRAVRRAVRFLDHDARAFMMGFGKRPMMSADDITHPDHTVSYELAFLPGSDAFYSFHGFLGERRSLPGRDGPPGARYNTLPELKPLPAQILDGYWREGNEGDWARYRSSRENGSGTAGFARAQAAVFHRNLDCLRRERNGCVLQ